MDISKTKLNFTLACRWISPSHQGGIAMHNGYLADLLKTNSEINIVSTENKTNRDYYEQAGVPFHGIKIPSSPFIQKLARMPFLKNGIRAWQDWQISNAMATALETMESDVIEFMDIHSEAYCYLKRHPRKNRKAKVVIRSHTPWALLKETYLPSEIKGVDGWWAVQREQFCLDECDAITTPSEDLKKQLIRIYNLPENKITVIPNILDTNHFKPVSIERDTNGFTFLHVGRFENAKGVITMTRAFIETAKEIPNIKLVNIGEPRGNAYQICISLLKEAGMLDKVDFTGFIPYEKLPDWYAKADAIIVPPEIYESFSYTVAQAMACGKQVIHSDSGGMPETSLNGEFALIFKKGDVHQLSNLMKKVIRQPRININAASYVKEKFGPHILSSVYHNYYSALV